MICMAEESKPIHSIMTTILTKAGSLGSLEATQDLMQTSKRKTIVVTQTPKMRSSVNDRKED
jgi:hypothetical protein